MKRTSLGLRDVLFDEIDALRSGTTTPQKASALARVATQIINSVKIEIEHQKHVASLVDAGNKVTPSAVLSLGSNRENVSVDKCETHAHT